MRSDEKSVVAHAPAVADLQRFIPDDAGLSRLWDTSSVDFAMALIRQKMFSADTVADGGKVAIRSWVLDAGRHARNPERSSNPHRPGAEAGSCR